MIWNWQEILGLIALVLLLITVWAWGPSDTSLFMPAALFLFCAFLFGLVSYIIQNDARSQTHARSKERTEIHARLNTMNTLVAAEEEYYRHSHRFAIDPDTLWLVSTDPQIRKSLRPLAVDGNSWQYQISPTGPFSLRSETIKLDTTYLSYLFRERNDYTVYLHSGPSGFLVQRICSAHYYCVDHRWAGIPSGQ